MKKLFSVFLAMVMLFTCAFSAVSLAETKALTEAQEQEMAKVLAWMLDGVPEEEYIQILSWDRETILKKLEGYDQPLETITKEEIADQLSQLIGVLSSFAGMFTGENGGKGLDLSGLLSMFGGSSGESASDSSVSLDLSGLLGAFGGSSGESASAVGESLDLSGLLGTFGASSGESASAVGESLDLSGLLDLFGGSSGESSDWGSEVYNGPIDFAFNGTFWESGDLTLESRYGNGRYSIVIYGPETALFYQGVLDEDTFDVNSASTGDPEMDVTQPDHGVAAFSVNVDGELVWKKAEGGEVTFTQIIDPLDGSQWFGGEKLVTIKWLGDLNYEVSIEEVGYTSVAWDYLCVLDKDKDVLDGSGTKTKRGNVAYSDSPVTFVFQADRTKLVWTDPSEPAAAEGLTFEAIEPLFTGYAIWEAEKEGVMVYTSWLDRYYDVSVYDGENAYEYLCTYDWETNTLTAVDPACIDFDSFSLYLDKASFISTATFVLEKDDTLVWHDDSGAAGDGIVLKLW